ncbi:MFS transporter [Vannielia litorea]|uniref:Major Facilitator Superfamily protein n=1 Tax=Vannielia litorea TaxID=1217970 RepID=A0A1N6FKG4_9RHOB|nr:MFS transporter [Vannielia litorea]SIN95762.1 Major Facilitator Superfamily protein [Vannielia litorea]
MTQSLSLLSPGTRGPVLAISAGIGMHAFNDLAISASIPVAMESLGALTMLPLVYALFFIAVVAGGVTSAEIRARIGARATALGAAGCFVAGTLLTATASSGAAFALGRALQGLSDGVIAALCYALIPQLFAAAVVARVFAVEATVWALAAALGPLAGGYATEHAGWRVAMLTGLPLALVFLATGAAILPRRAADGFVIQRRTPLGPVALCLAGAAVLALPSALPESPAAALGLPAGLALLALALATDRRRPRPRFFPSGAFTLTPLGAGTWLIFLMPVAQSVSSIFTALCTRAIFGLSTILTGWVVVTMALNWSLWAVVAGRLPAHRRQAALRVAPALQIAGAACVGTGFVTATLPLVLLGQSLSGAAFGLSWGPANQLVMEAAPEAERPRTASFMPTVQTLGFATGAGLFGWIAGVTGLLPALATGATVLPLAALWGTAALIACTALLAARRLHTASSADPAPSSPAPSDPAPAP